jgi:hypothetical protein
LPYLPLDRLSKSRSSSLAKPTQQLEADESRPELTSLQKPRGGRP